MRAAIYARVSYHGPKLRDAVARTAGIHVTPRMGEWRRIATSYGVRFIATSQSLDTDGKNPASRLLLQILASVAVGHRVGRGNQRGRWCKVEPGYVGLPGASFRTWKCSRPPVIY